MHDVFRPRMEPHRSIYDAFQSEATKRRERSVEDWIKAEMDVVYQAALKASQVPGSTLRAPTMDMVRVAEIYARGSVDYGLKWVCQLVRGMQQPQVPRTDIRIVEGDGRAHLE